ncbi:MAG: hypothetical protein DI552_00200 [Brevundimonas sp.]|nr:MAG: hypothetical protein DI552_00200 [Brevundimonas sp.]
MTQAEFAKHRGVGRSAVSNYKSKGLLVFGEGEDGAVLVDVARTEARLNAKVDPTRGRPTTGQTGGMAEEAAPATSAVSGPRPDGVAQVRMELVQQQVIERRFANARRAGELAPMVELEKRASEIGRIARERMQSMLRTLADRFAAEKDPRQIVAVGALEIERIFSDLADMVEAGTLSSDDQLDAELAAETAAQEAGDDGDDELLAEAG